MILSDFYSNIFTRAKDMLRDQATAQPEGDVAQIFSEVLRSRSSEGLSNEATARLLAYAGTPAMRRALPLMRIFSRELRRTCFGQSFTAMAPVEFSSVCASNCSFCSWRSSNQGVMRLRSSLELFEQEVDHLLSRGFTHLELASGDDLSFLRRNLLPTLESMRTRAAVLGVDAATSICLTPLPSSQYEKISGLKLADTVLTWQETYDRNRFHELVMGGPKKFGLNGILEIDRRIDGFDYRLESQERAVQAGLQVGLGTMIGLAEDFRADILSAVMHARELLLTYPDMKPIIMGLPVLCGTNGTYSEIQSYLPLGITADEIVEFVAYLYLFALPNRKAWIFANGRVSPECQARIVENASNFTSTEVFLTPGAYAPSGTGIKRSIQEYAASAKIEKSPNLTTEVLRGGEQFQHSVVNHESFIDLLSSRGLEVCSEAKFFEQVASSC